MGEQFDVIAMGRLGVDIYPRQIGVGLAEVETFAKYLGGTAGNVAVATARYGHRVALVSRTGADPFGAYLHRVLRESGVDDRYVTDVPDLPTPVTFCEIFPPDDFPVYFYRLPKAPDLVIHEHELDVAAIRAARILWVTVTGLCEEPSRTATLAAVRARDPDSLTVLDLDYRPAFWPSRVDARRRVQEALPHVTVTVGNLDECDTAVGTRDPVEAAEALRTKGIQLAVVKKGPAGVLAVDDTGSVTVPPHPVEVVNGLGAGDAFGGALCHGLLNGWDTARTMRYGNAAGAIVASRLSCSAAMPTAGEVEAVLDAD